MLIFRTVNGDHPIKPLTIRQLVRKYEQLWILKRDAITIVVIDRPSIHIGMGYKLVSTWKMGANKCVITRIGKHPKFIKLRETAKPKEDEWKTKTFSPNSYIKRNVEDEDGKKRSVRIEGIPDSLLPNHSRSMKSSGLARLRAQILGQRKDKKKPYKRKGSGSADALARIKEKRAALAKR